MTENKTIRRYTHSPMKIEHNDITAEIMENGRIILTRNIGETEFDSVEVPASLIFKLSMLLRATRSVKYINVAEKDALEM